MYLSTHSRRKIRQCQLVETHQLILGVRLCKLILDQLLFQHLIAVRENYEDTSALFKYEMCTFHPSLFDNFALPREANKPQLADAIWSTAELDEEKMPPTKDVLLGV